MEMKIKFKRKSQTWMMNEATTSWMSIFITRDKMSAEDKYYNMIDKQTIKHNGRVSQHLGRDELCERGHYIIKDKCYTMDD